jgi:hypothetical protein
MTGTLASRLSPRGDPLWRRFRINASPCEWSGQIPNTATGVGRGEEPGRALSLWAPLVFARVDSRVD